MPDRKGDLSVTALYTSQVWTWGALPAAHLFATVDAKRVFDATNGALKVASVFKKAPPSLPHSLLHRHTMIDHLLRDSAATRVLELAAGLSRRGAAFTADERLMYTEVDLPHVVEKKRALLARTDEGQAVLARPNLRLVGANVESAALEDWAQRDAPLFVIAEGLMMYLAAADQRRLFGRVRKLAEIAGELTFVFDLVPTSEQPPPGVVGRTLEGAMKRFTGGRSFEKDARSRSDIADDLREVGFASVAMVEPADVAGPWDLPHPGEKTQMLLFVGKARRQG